MARSFRENFVGAGFSPLQIEVLENWVNSGVLSNVIDARDFGFVSGDVGTVDRTEAWLAIIDAALVNGGSSIQMPSGFAKVTVGAVANKAIFVIGQGLASGINFVPTTPNDTLLYFNHPANTYTPALSVNEETQMFGMGFRDICIKSDRSVRANGMHVEHCDWVSMNNVLFYGLDGYATNCRAREMRWDGFQARYCGHPALVNPVDGVASVLMQSEDTAGDNTNLCSFSNFSVVFSFWDEIYHNRASDMAYTNGLLHGMVRGTPNFENLVIQAFGGTPGWAADGTPRNQYAALHKKISAPGVQQTNTTGSVWLPSMYKSVVHRSTAGSPFGSSGRFSNFVIKGKTSDITALHMDGSAWTYKSCTIDGAEATSGRYVDAVVTVDATLDTLTFAVAQPNLLTGTPFVLTNPQGLGSSVPGGLSNAGRYKLTTRYAINVDSGAGLVFKVADSYRHALAGTALDITSVVAGCFVKSEYAAVMVGTCGSSIAVDAECSINSGQSIFRTDDSSVAKGYPSVTQIGALDQTQLLGPPHVLFKLHGADLSASGVAVDQIFSQFGHNRKLITEIWARGKNGIPSGGGPFGGIYTGPGKTGTVIVDPETDWSSLAYNKFMRLPISSTPSTTPLGIDADLYLYIDETSGINTCGADIYVWGIDGGVGDLE